MACVCFRSALVCSDSKELLYRLNSLWDDTRDPRLKNHKAKDQSVVTAEVQPDVAQVKLVFEITRTEKLNNDHNQKK